MFRKTLLAVALAVMAFGAAGSAEAGHGHRGGHYHGGHGGYYGGGPRYSSYYRGGYGYGGPRYRSSYYGPGYSPYYGGYGGYGYGGPRGYYGGSGVTFSIGF
jgi:hypothetical protein